MSIFSRFSKRKEEAKEELYNAKALEEQNTWEEIRKERELARERVRQAQQAKEQKILAERQGQKVSREGLEYVITGKRALKEPVYIMSGTPNSKSFCKNLTNLPENIFDNLENYARRAFDYGRMYYDSRKLGFMGQEVVPLFFDDCIFHEINRREMDATCNDIIALIFYHSGETSRPRDPCSNRITDGGMAVFIDAQDYANLDVQEFINRIDAEIKQSPNGKVWLNYPVFWDYDYINGLLKDGDIHGYDAIAGETFSFLGISRASELPKVIPYDKAIKTKDGKPFIGSIRINPTAPGYVDDSLLLKDEGTEIKNENIEKANIEDEKPIMEKIDAKEVQENKQEHTESNEVSDVPKKIITISNERKINAQKTKSEVNEIDAELARIREELNEFNKKTLEQISNIKQKDDKQA